MSTEATVALIIGGLGLIGSIIAGIFAFVSGRKSAKKDDVDALRGIIQELRTYINDLEADKEDLQEWAERLVCQVKESGKEPVKFIRKERPHKPQ